MSKIRKRPLGSPIVWIENFFKGLEKNDVDVPCGTCDACCHSFDKIYLHPDEAHKYEHDILDNMLLTLKIDPATNRCSYLGEKGCEIYEDRPLNCRQFDCRALAHCGVVPADYPDLKDAVLGWEVAFKTDGEKILAMALRLSAREVAVEEGQSALKASGHAVMGGYKDWIGQAKAVVKNEKILAKAQEKPKFLDSKGQTIR